MLTFEQILHVSPFFSNGKFCIDKFLINHKLYFAHLPPSGVNKNAENLEEHLSLVVEYFLRICEVQQLNVVVDKLIESIVPISTIDRLGVSNHIKVLLFDVIIYHDFGKVNHLFQYKRMLNEDSNIPILEHHFAHNHSALGAYLFAIHHYADNEFEGETQSLLDFLITMFTYPILKHHSKFLLSPLVNIDFGDNGEDFKQYINLFSIHINENLLGILHESLIKNSSDKLKMLYHGDIQTLGLVNVFTNPFALFALIKLSFSLLTASDYLATNEYMTSIKIEDLGVLNQERKKSIHDNVKSRIHYNKITYQHYDKYTLQRPTNLSNDNLNILRMEMAIEVIRNVRQYKDNNLFYIEAPTGGGKTNLSLLATAEFLIANPSINKVIYVFPFTTLITQTYKNIIETMGLKDDEIVQIHSKSGFQSKESEDGQYGIDKQNFIDNLFVNFPFSLITHIKFFDILKTNEKEANYILHRLANSVVVIDELQSYNPAHWDKIIYFIRNYSKYFNIKFILMSATLPKLDKLKVLKDQVNDFVYLLENPQRDYFQNPNFQNRVNFKFDLLQEPTLRLDSLANLVLQYSEDYAKFDFNKSKPSNSVYTIIEFIFKKSATQFYNIIKNKNNFFDEIFVLSGTILEHRRRYIINYLKNPSNRVKKILLISTQVVEAGVDIDMDLGFKNKSLIDSDEQLAGRINRNVNKGNCDLYLFNYDESRILYSQDKRYEITKSQINQIEYEDILKHKNFDKLYDLVLENIDKWNEKNMAVRFQDYLDEIINLNYPQVSQKFKLIDQDNISIFVPLNIPIEIEGQTDSQMDIIFSKTELDFLAKSNIYPNNENKIKGEEVFNLYFKLALNRETDFIARRIRFEILQGIMSKFVFSIFASTKDKVELLKYSTEYDKNQLGYFYLNAYESIYSSDMGLDLSFDGTIII